MAKAKNKRVEVFAPRNSANQDPNCFVGVNGVNYILPRGKRSQVPDFVAEEFERSQAAEEKMYEEQDKLKGNLPDKAK